MSRKIIFGLLIALAFVPDRLPGAAAPVKIQRIGYLTANSSAVELSRIDAFRQGLRDRGYVEGQNVLIDYRFTDGRFDRLPAAAAELVCLKVDVLVANTTNAALAAKNATGAIPIFFIGVSDPIEAGLVQSLAPAGGQYHRIDQHCTGVIGQTIGVTQRNGSKARPRCRAVGPAEPRLHSTMEGK